KAASAPSGSVCRAQERSTQASITADACLDYNSVAIPVLDFKTAPAKVWKQGNTRRTNLFQLR
ncbi:MAG: hypothetical protein QGG73_05425, partial [Candidatus Hydrogenedentes bacterium]|nr:hypothetical protein [Candidatus Hydrogenedentota bacterium]